MKTCKLPRILLAGTESGCGKTTLTCGILQAFLKRKIKPVAFKSGPDYIDPMFHSSVFGITSRNLDSFMLNTRTLRYLLAKNGGKGQLAVLEGAMGYYDGVGVSTKASAYELAVSTQTPVILIINGKGSGISLAAKIKGFKEFKANSNIVGVILNNVTTATLKKYKTAIEQETGLKILGNLPVLPDCQLGSRHLGLITAEEVADLQQILAKLAAEVEANIDLDALLAIAQSAAPLNYEDLSVKPLAKVKIAVARDKAFCFYYQDALDLLGELGAELLPFSPLQTSELPSCDGLILGGGYPELYAAELAANKTLKASLKAALQKGLPCWAECGGYMYLQETFQAEGRVYPWLGYLPGSCLMTEHLQHFGYVELLAQQANVLMPKGTRCLGHEFHYSRSTVPGEALCLKKASGWQEWEAGFGGKNLLALYAHLHLWQNVELARNFIKACTHYHCKVLGEAPLC